MRLRPATHSDVKQIAELDASALGADAWTEDSVRAELLADAATRVVLVAERAGQLLGYAVLALSGTSAEVRRVAVAAAAQRCGVGSALLGELLDVAAGHGGCAVFLEVRADNAAALGLYAQFGFTELYRRRRYYADGADALVMRAAARSASAH